MLASAAFATTPAGYISGIVIPLILGAFIGMSERNRRRNDARLEHIETTAANNAETSAKRDQDLSAAMTTNTQALAIIVERIAPMLTAIAQNSASAITLGESVAVLKSKMADHEKWAATEHERVMSTLQRRQ